MKTQVKALFARLGLSVHRLGAPLTGLFDHLILENQLRIAGPDFFFVQVGACDGVSFDNLFEVVTRNKVKGIVIEPLPDLYEQLTKNYEGFPAVKPVNVALHSSSKQMELYRVPPGVDAPIWAKGIASFDPEHHRRAGIPSTQIVRESVKCVSWDELLDQHRVERIDYLQIDAEGYDYEILAMVRHGRIRPQIIKFEHNLGSGIGAKREFETCISQFVELNYKVVVGGQDAIAYSE